MDTSPVPPATQEPDVLLDVRDLEVDKLTLEVDDLRAHVSLMAELANLLNLSVGVDATLAAVKLEIDGVEANVLLKVRLEQVRAILEKALDTIAEHPEILTSLSESLGSVAREALGTAQGNLAEILGGLQVGAPVDDALKGRLEELRASLAAILQRGDIGRGGGRAAQRALGAPSADVPASSGSAERK
jgi:hypothetical protein